jgi:hypothetical protein
MSDRVAGGRATHELRVIAACADLTGRIQAPWSMYTRSASRWARWHGPRSTRGGCTPGSGQGGHPPAVRLFPDLAANAPTTRVLGASRRRGTRSSFACSQIEARPSLPIPGSPRRSFTSQIVDGRLCTKPCADSFCPGDEKAARSGRRRPRKGRTDEDRGARALRGSVRRGGDSPRVRCRQRHPAPRRKASRTGTTVPRGRGRRARRGWPVRLVSCCRLSDSQSWLRRSIQGVRELGPAARSVRARRRG